MKIISRSIYAVLGILAIGLGVLALFRPALALPPGEVSPLTSHLIQEQGAEGIFIGLMALWCFARFDARRSVHFALLLFASIFAAIHWSEFAHGRRHLLSPLLNSIPFVLLLVATPLRRANEASTRNG